MAPKCLIMLSDADFDGKRTMLIGITEEFLSKVKGEGVSDLLDISKDGYPLKVGVIVGKTESDIINKIEKHNQEIATTHIEVSQNKN